MQKVKLSNSRGHLTQLHTAMDADTIVQYIAVRKDLKWPTGAVVAQACHASTAVIWEGRDDAATQAYLADVNNMHKIVVGVESEEALRTAAEEMAAAGVGHRLWTEQPENILTCLATRPARRELLAPFFKAFRLLR